ncbi:FAD binding domain-containing protein [Streptomyces sp. NPDC088387]|uniref:FAD binding domain-containing protein n=1 Tax=Streptomyces sp. NPDC088387 TaxID=3365859 RepID=UPI00380933FC
MHPVDFSYTAASSVSQVCAELPADLDGTRLLAGGMSLLPALIRREARPRRLIDITGIPQLRHLSTSAAGLHVGAGITQRTLERSSELAGYELLRRALPLVGTVPTRNRGTICGSLAHADPAAQLGVCLVALGGELTARSSSGVRRIPATEFFRGPYRTALRRDELLTKVTFERPAVGTLCYFDQVSLRGVGDRPLVSMALTVRAGRNNQPRLVVGGAGQRPLAAPAEIMALAADPSDDAIAAAATALGRAVQFADDARATAAHRQRLSVRLFGRLLRQWREDIR